MLRKALIAVGALLMLAGIVDVLAGVGSSSLLPLAIGAILVAGVIFEPWRYKKIVSEPEAGWQRTGERFVDPETGRLTEVYYDGATGRRHYVEAKKQ
jgi:hypothetical protein